jgi:hypothetical protein
MKERFRGLFPSGTAPVEIEPHIFSATPSLNSKRHYDRIGPLYDLIVGAESYNRFLWDNSRSDYTKFALDAVTFAGTSVLCEILCGSLLFSSVPLVHSTGLVVAVDHSITMLRLARRRLLRSNVSFPVHIFLVHADVFHLPFRPRSINAFLGIHALHMFKRPSTLLSSLKPLLAANATLFFTSLITSDHSIGNSYLRLLLRLKEVASVFTSEELEREIDKSQFAAQRSYQQGNVDFEILTTGH